jgi:hypothetical protein
VPQLPLSVCVSVQPAPGQLVSEPPQVHTPDTQLEPVPQTRPHAPQLFASVAVVTHWLPQMISPAPHMQVPPVHVAPIGHECPQTPQLSGSVVSPVVQPITVPAEHIIVPDGQPHTPAVHVEPGPQLTQAAPQCAGSVWVSKQPPHAIVRGA